MGTTRRMLTLTALLIAALPLRAQDTGGRSTAMTHPLVPGVRCDEIHNPNWPRTLHDKHLTGFSPLKLGMTESPEVWATLEIGGVLQWVQTIRVQGATRLLAYDERLRLITLDGHVEWTNEERATRFVYSGDIRGNGRDYLLVSQGPRLTLIEAATGQRDWSFVFDDVSVNLNVEVADILPDHPGFEAAVFQGHGVEACLFQFPPKGEPATLWRVNAVNPAEGWTGRGDHGVYIKLDLSVPDEPMIWNVRHHRCFGFDARTGERVSALEYDIAGGHRRNYCQWDLGVGEGGRPLLCIIADASVMKHAHAIRLNRRGQSKLAWEHAFGLTYQYPDHAVVLKHVHVGDVDKDGFTEMIYNVLDPARQFRAFVRVCNADTGAVEIELADQWAVAPFVDVGDEHAAGLLTLSTPRGVIATSGDMAVRLFAGDGKLTDIGTIRQARLWGPHLPRGDQGNVILLREDHVLVRRTVRGGKLFEVSRTEAPALLQSPIRNIVSLGEGGHQYQVVTAHGKLQSVSWPGKLMWELPLQVTRPPVVSAVDLNDDGRAELIAAGGDQRVRITAFSNSGRAEEAANHEHRMEAERHSPLLFDLTGDGNMCLIAPGTTDDRKIAIRAFRANGVLFWESPLDFSIAYNGRVVTCKAASSLPDGSDAVVIQVSNSLRSDDATFGLDGRTGKILWVKRGTYNGMPYRPEGIVGAVDVDGDGMDELANDMLAYMSYVRGADGSYALIKSLGELGAAGLYSCFIPLYRGANDAKPHWLVPSGTGRFGMMGPELKTIWVEYVG